MAELNKKTLEYLAELARINLEAPTPEGGRGPDRSVGKKLLKDLQAILDYVKELQEADTAGVEPMTGGTDLKNVFRKDNPRITGEIAKGAEAFPETHDNYLKVPPIF